MMGEGGVFMHGILVTLIDKKINVILRASLYLFNLNKIIHLTIHNEGASYATFFKSFWF